LGIIRDTSESNISNFLIASGSITIPSADVLPTIRGISIKFSVVKISNGFLVIMAFS